MISTIAKAHSSMITSLLWTGLSLSVHFAEVLHKEYTMASHVPLRNGYVYTSELGGRQFLSGSTQGAEDAATHGVLC